MYWLFLSLPPPSRWHQQPDPVVRPQVSVRPDFRKRRTGTPASEEWNTRPFGKCSTPRRPDITVIPRSGPSLHSGYFSYHVSVLQFFARTQLASENRRHKDQQAAQLCRESDQGLVDVVDLFISSCQFLDRFDDIIVFIGLSSKSGNGCTISHYLHSCRCEGEPSFLILNQNYPTC